MKKKLWGVALVVVMIGGSCTPPTAAPYRRKMAEAHRPDAIGTGGVGAFFGAVVGTVLRRPGKPPRPGYRSRPRVARPPRTVIRAGGRELSRPRAKREHFKRARERSRLTKERWKKREVW